MERINKQKAKQFVQGLENSNPTAEAFQRINNLVRGRPMEQNVRPRQDIYAEPQPERPDVADKFSPDSYKTFSDTNLDRQKADETLRRLRGEQPSQPQAAPAIPGDTKALMDQQQYLEQLQDFDRATPEDVQKLQRIKELLRTK